MKTIIIDDESKSRSILSTMLERYCDDVQLIGEASNIREGLRLIENGEPDLLFLDVQMPGGNGFDLLNQLESKGIQVVFVTAHQEYAIQAIRTEALDYLLKPLNIRELCSAVERARNRKTETFQPVPKTTRPEQHVSGKIVVPDRSGLSFIDIKSILRLEAEGNYTRIYLSNGKNLLSTHLLKEYAMSLPEAGFFRVHHSHIINLEYIVYYERGEGGNIVMSDQSIIGLSKRRKKEFLDRFRLIQ